MSDGSVVAALRVLVLAPSGADARAAAELLGDHDMPACVCNGIPDMCDRLEQGAGALLLTEEALTGEEPELLTVQLAAQEPWSDIPIIVLTSRREDARWREVLASLFAASGNLTLIERPCSTSALASAVQVALRARRKQYEARELLLREQRARHETASALECERAARADAPPRICTSRSPEAADCAGIRAGPPSCGPPASVRGIRTASTTNGSPCCGSTSSAPSTGSRPVAPRTRSPPSGPF